MGSSWQDSGEYDDKDPKNKNTNKNKNKSKK